MEAAHKVSVGPLEQVDTLWLRHPVSSAPFPQNNHERLTLPNGIKISSLDYSVYHFNEGGVSGSTSVIHELELKLRPFSAERKKRPHRWPFY